MPLNQEKFGATHLRKSAETYSLVYKSYRTQCRILDEYLTPLLFPIKLTKCSYRRFLSAKPFSLVRTFSLTHTLAYEELWFTVWRFIHFLSDNKFSFCNSCSKCVINLFLLLECFFYFFFLSFPSIYHLVSRQVTGFCPLSLSMMPNDYSYIRNSAKNVFYIRASRDHAK